MENSKYEDISNEQSISFNSTANSAFSSTKTKDTYIYIQNPVENNTICTDNNKMQPSSETKKILDSGHADSTSSDSDASSKSYSVKEDSNGIRRYYQEFDVEEDERICGVFSKWNFLITSIYSAAHFLSIVATGVSFVSKCYTVWDVTLLSVRKTYGQLLEMINIPMVQTAFAVINTVMNWDLFDFDMCENNLMLANGILSSIGVFSAVYLVFFAELPMYVQILKYFLEYYILFNPWLFLLAYTEQILTFILFIARSRKEKRRCIFIYLIIYFLEGIFSIALFLYQGVFLSKVDSFIKSLNLVIAQND
ncbi:hypothetical protein NEMIN01_1902 [Nematocida minor]|uniref:uncharacterized protein n=1 Tax=Nematocida minor TaxID=1912983 RepID=UPI002220BD98|nr:uncharacterized protein NEMIN01_1902 [Nematocida minor]KAI5192250.1 hypothetical protein NEMIN01_1902 [Nematocida minor]